MHPSLDREFIISNYLKNYKKKYWHISNYHILDLASRSDICIGPMTSACLDALAQKVPTIDYYDTEYEMKKSSRLKTMLNVAYDKKTKKMVTYFYF